MGQSEIERWEDDPASAAKIASVHADVVQIPLKKTYSMGGQDFSGWDYYGLVVRVRTEDGVEGVSEVFVTPGWYGPDTPGSCQFLIELVYGPAMIGESVFDTAKLLQKMDQLWMHNLWSKAVLEQALFDAAAKTVNRPLVDLMGGKVRDRFPLVGGIGTDSPEGMAASAREFVDRGFSTIKMKIGDMSKKTTLDVERVKLVREEVGPDIIIRADANGVFGNDVQAAIKLARALEPFDLDHLEQPLAADCIEGMARIRESIDIPLMADESVHSLRDAIAVVKAGAADIVKLKMAKNGGYQKCRDIITVCTSAGIAIELGNGLQTSAASLHELNLACSNALVQPAGEFTGPDKLVSDILQQPMQIVNGEAILPTGAGIGSGLDYDAFNACRIEVRDALGYNK
jgi:L-alanine-DL-glutamate epimerase-like enolase superfamily enzyme